MSQIIKILDLIGNKIVICKIHYDMIDDREGEFKKNSFEAVSYGKEIANNLDSRLTTLKFGSKKPSSKQTLVVE